MNDKNTIMHLKDDVYVAQGVHRYNCRRDKSMLMDALHAARTGKMYVVIDHLERTIESMQKQLDNLS